MVTPFFHNILAICDIELENGFHFLGDVWICLDAILNLRKN